MKTHVSGTFAHLLGTLLVPECKRGVFHAAGLSAASNIYHYRPSADSIDAAASTLLDGAHARLKVVLAFSFWFSRRLEQCRSLCRVRVQQALAAVRVIGASPQGNSDGLAPPSHLLANRLESILRFVPPTLGLALVGNNHRINLVRPALILHCIHK
jgi:hypothetical protein